MGFTKKQYESIARKIKLFSPAFERGIPEGEFEKRLKGIEQQIVEKRLARYENGVNYFQARSKNDFLYLPSETPLTKALTFLFAGVMDLNPGPHPLWDSVGAFLLYDSQSKLYFAEIESRNFCPYLEAFKRMHLSPKMSAYLCKNVLEKPCQAIVEKIHPGIKFSRDYKKIRPLMDSCEEYMWIEDYTPFPDTPYHYIPFWGQAQDVMNNRDFQYALEKSSSAEDFMHNKFQEWKRIIKSIAKC